MLEQLEPNRARFFKPQPGGASAPLNKLRETAACADGPCGGVLSRPDCWFQMHRTAQVSGLLLAFVGFFAILATVSDEYGGTHLWSRERDSDTYPSLLEDPQAAAASSTTTSSPATSSSTRTATRRPVSRIFEEGLYCVRLQHGFSIGQPQKCV